MNDKSGMGNKKTFGHIYHKSSGGIEYRLYTEQQCKISVVSDKTQHISTLLKLS